MDDDDEKWELEMEVAGWVEEFYAHLDFEIKPGGVYTTYDHQKAVVMYLLQENKTVFFGHVYEGTEEGPIAVQWDRYGKVDERLHERGYNLESVWETPKKHLRWVWLFKDDKGAVSTKVSETSETSETPRGGGTLIAKTKVILTEF